MLFNSFEYLLFFPFVALVYYLLPYNKERWIWLLSASCFFYGYIYPPYLLVLLAAVLIDYGAAFGIERAKNKRQKKVWLWLSILATCSLLFVFKYADFVFKNIGLVSAQFGHPLPPLIIDWVLPVGLSFHTFQSLAYVIEVYNGRQPIEKNFIVYALYVMFFPQLVAGPIERPQNMLPQFHILHKVNLERIGEGLLLIMWGLYKKAVIADGIATMVNTIYGNNKEYSGGLLLLATIGFGVQIYCDFSGYTDMAIGSAKCLGFNFSPNFQNPYHAVSVGDFWRRWHISLSSWFRDYLYKPLGGNKVGILLNFRNILIVFVVSGLWHGAKWTFIVWGLVHGIALISERLSGFFYQKINKKPLPFLGWLWTMFIVMGSWIFFRAENLKQAREIIKGIIQKPFYGLEIFWNNGGIWEEASFHKQLSGIWAGQLYILVGCTLLMFFLELLHAKKDMYKLLSALPWALQCLIYSILVWVIVLLGTFDNNMEFIYFQF